MIGEYGLLAAAKIQTFRAQAIRRPAGALMPHSDTVSVHTDGVILATEDTTERGNAMRGWRPAFVLTPGKQYRVTVEEVE